MSKKNYKNKFNFWRTVGILNSVKLKKWFTKKCMQTKSLEA